MFFVICYPITVNIIIKMIWNAITITVFIFIIFILFIWNSIVVIVRVKMIGDSISI